jgi:hypothetical protein
MCGCGADGKLQQIAILGAATIQSSLCGELQLVCSLIFAGTNLVFPMLSMGGLAQAPTPPTLTFGGLPIGQGTPKLA